MPVCLIIFVKMFISLRLISKWNNNKWACRRTKGSCKSDSWPNKQFLSILQHRRAERISVWARFHESESQPSVPEPAFFSYWFSLSFPILPESVSASLSDTFSNKDAARRRRCKITTWSEPLKRSPHPPRYSSESHHAATASRGEFFDYSKFFSETDYNGWSQVIED